MHTHIRLAHHNHHSSNRSSNNNRNHSKRRNRQNPLILKGLEIFKKIENKIKESNKIDT